MAAMVIVFERCFAKLTILESQANCCFRWGLAPKTIYQCKMAFLECLFLSITKKTSQLENLWVKEIFSLSKERYPC